MERPRTVSQVFFSVVGRCCDRHAEIISIPAEKKDLCPRREGVFLMPPSLLGTKNRPGRAAKNPSWYFYCVYPRLVATQKSDYLRGSYTKNARRRVSPPTTRQVAGGGEKQRTFPSLLRLFSVADGRVHSARLKYVPRPNRMYPIRLKNKHRKQTISTMNAARRYNLLSLRLSPRVSSTGPLATVGGELTAFPSEKSRGDLGVLGQGLQRNSPRYIFPLLFPYSYYCSYISHRSIIHHPLYTIISTRNILPALLRINNMS